jgi:1-acyl-sn-glycerol-3-phosphate acyltransferase
MPATSTPDTDDARAGCLYDATALVFGAFAHARLRLELHGREHLRVARGDLLVLTHRAFVDVAVASSLYVPLGLWRSRQTRVHVAARDDLFARGFLAGFVPGLPPWLRAALFRVSLAATLERLRVHPLPTARELKLCQLLALLPRTTPLDSVLAPAALERLGARSAAHGLRLPRTVAGLDRPAFAGVLLETIRPEDCRGEQAARIWQQRAGECVAALRDLVRVARAGEPLLLFPEGRVSPDGSIGPLERAFALVVRRGGIRSILPIALCYDPLTPGRTRAYVSAGERLDPSGDDVETRTLRALQLLTPLTCGQVVSERLLTMAGAEVEAPIVPASTLARELEAARRTAQAEGRPVERALRSTAGRRRRLRECLTALRRQGCLVSDPAGERLVPSAILASPLVRRLARERASAREL